MEGVIILAFDVTKPTDNQTIAAGPADIRENFRALKDDKVVNAQKVMDLAPGNASGNIPVSNGILCTNLNAEKLGGNLANAFATAGHTHAVATTSSNGLLSNTDKAKIDGIAAGAEVNQNAFGSILVGATTIQADSKTDTLELVAGTNIALTPDATNDKLTIAVVGTVASAASCTGNAATATSCTGNSATASSCTGNSATATKLQTSRTINGVGFDGSANITITAAANGGTSSACSGNAATATKLSTARAINGVSFDGSSDITITIGSQVAVLYGTVTNGGVLPIPNGYTKEQCSWIVSPNYYINNNYDNMYQYSIYCSVDSTTLKVTVKVWSNGRYGNGDNSSCTANYLVIGVK